jgi:hypothetical protein
LFTGRQNVRYTLRLSHARALIGAALAVAIVASANLAAPADAGAATRAKTITRTKVIERSRSWVRKRIMYSQRSYYQGYRRDCSGFVSMSWAMGTSYTTRSLPSVAKRISTSNLRPGDAVITPGHAVIFGGWKSKRSRTFYAYEERTWGKPAMKTVRRITSGSKAYRRPGIRSATSAAAAKPAPAPVKPGPDVVGDTKGEDLTAVIMPTVPVASTTGSNTPIPAEEATLTASAPL